MSRPQAGYLPTIPVVDDSREIAETARGAFAEAAHRVVVAHSAEEALRTFDEAAVREGAMDLVFSDVIMAGGENGLVRRSG